MEITAFKCSKCGLVYEDCQDAVCCCPPIIIIAHKCSECSSIYENEKDYIDCCKYDD
jgi:hypothetical protein